MTTYTADLHIHSKFSRATSKHLTPRHLAAWAEVKGVDVLATGDFTHPGWMELIRAELVEDEGGLFRLGDTAGLNAELPWLTRELTGSARFVLCTEISSIYKKDGKVRKNHNLVFMPNLDAVERLNRKLAQVGNLASDGRPILGLDARDLLEMVLETHEEAFLVPAHVWTPWFSLFGSKSGFDSIEECFGDLASEIFALETGLSSDPEMNWLWSALDRFTLISNSDAHSGEKLAREVNVFSGEKSYTGMRLALRREEGPTRFAGTVEFYPEEGKYHLDGHRKCGVFLEPRETATYNGICPVCGKPLTIGVLNRVFELADRQVPQRPAHQPGFVSLVPLPEVLGEILGVGPGSKKVTAMYTQLLREFGSELDIVRTVPPEALRRSSRLVAEAVRRMRQRLVHRESGYDGEYGRIRMFTPEELLELRHGRVLAVPGCGIQPKADQDWRVAVRPTAAAVSEDAPTEPNEAQRAAVLAGPGPVLVLAGPGTGKTHTLMARVRHLLDQGVDPGRMLVVTFTRRAARELHQRLARLCPDGVLPRADTLHALALDQWTSARGQAPTLLSEESARRVFAVANPHLRGKALKTAWTEQALAREAGVAVPDDATRRYQEQKTLWNLVDYTDLLEFWAKRVKWAGHVSEHDHVLVDEVQDLSPMQLDLVLALAPENGRGFFAIGDPDQAIYAFRGAVRDVAARLLERWPETRRIRLIENYRSAQDILTVSGALFPGRDALVARKTLPASLAMFEAQTGDQEASWVAGRVRELVGGTGHWQADLGGPQTMGPGDIAVLVRFKALVGPLERALQNAGIPVSAPESEAFFLDDRVVLLLRLASNMLGMPDTGGADLPPCPEEVVRDGPRAMAVHLAETAPFDRVFWTTRAFVELEKSFRALGGWREVLNMVQLETDLGEVRSKAQKVQIMTLHAAKGLEFEAVFLPGLEEGILPFAGMDALLNATAGSTADPDEELRLFYVGLTRAKRLLFLSHCAGRKIFGKSLRLGPSSFLSRLPLALIHKTALKSRVRRGERQLSLF